MNDARDLCSYHPNQVLVGVCPICLNDKLLLIAEKQEPVHSRKPSNGGLLALGSILSRLDLRRSHRRKSCDLDDDCGGGSDTQSTSASLSFEDSFISIKFEEDGVVCWDKSKVSEEASWGANINATTDHPHKGSLYKEGNWKSYSNKSVGEGSLRWRKRIGHLLQLVRGKRLKKPNGG